MNLIKLPNSIPFNDSEPSPLGATVSYMNLPLCHVFTKSYSGNPFLFCPKDNASHSSQLSLFRAMDPEAASRSKGLQLPKLEKPGDSKPLIQATELEAKFVLESKIRSVEELRLIFFDFCFTSDLTICYLL